MWTLIARHIPGTLAHERERAKRRADYRALGAAARGRDASASATADASARHATDAVQSILMANSWGVDDTYRLPAAGRQVEDARRSDCEISSPGWSAPADTSRDSYGASESYGSSYSSSYGSSYGSSSYGGSSGSDSSSSSSSDSGSSSSCD